MANRGIISSSSGFNSEGDAGNIIIQAEDLKVLGDIDSETWGSGNGGLVNISVTECIELLKGGRISSSTNGEGNAGSVIIQSKDIRINGQGESTLIASTASHASKGNAGEIEIKVNESIELLGGAGIAASTGSEGNAGSIVIESSELRIDGQRCSAEILTGIDSRALEESEGYVGDVFISANTITIQNEGQISIAALNTLPHDRLSEVPDSLIRIVGKSVYFDKNAKISAESIGNVPAADLYVDANDLKIENESRITTKSIDADGGSVIIGGERIILRDGLITTSVEGISGDGGDIIVAGSSVKPSNVIMLYGGFIQANTTAESAFGGDIFINAKAVIAENGLLEVGGLKGQVFEPGSSINVIQAAAPGGEQGNIAITAPNLDISGALINIAADFSEPAKMATDPCSAAAIKMPSSLVLCGHGGIAEGPDDPLDGSFERRWLELRK